MNKMDITNDLNPYVDGLHHVQASIDAISTRRDLSDGDKEFIRDLRTIQIKMIQRLREVV